jgi:general secretion pathway protein I
MYPSETRARGGRAAGFTLLEVVVAFAILSLAFGAIFAVLSSTLRQVSQTDSERNAIALAQSMLARVGADLPLVDGDRTGEASTGAQWRLSIRPYNVTGRDNLLPMSAHQVSITVSWVSGRARTLTLTSLRLARRTRNP